MLADEPPELGDEVGMAAERQVGLDPLLERGQAQLLEPADLLAGEVLIGEVGERRTAPEGERLAQEVRGRLRIRRPKRPPAAEELLEAVEIALAPLQAKQIAVAVRLKRRCSVTAEGAAELGDVVVQHVRRRRRGALAPQDVDQAVSGEHLVGVEQQQRKHNPLLAAPDGHLPAGLAGLERSEYAELHRSSPGEHTAALRPGISRHLAVIGARLLPRCSLCTAASGGRDTATGRNTWPEGSRG